MSPPRDAFSYTNPGVMMKLTLPDLFIVASISPPRRRQRRLQRVLHGDISGRSCAKGCHRVSQTTARTREPISYIAYESNGAETGTGGTLKAALARDRGTRGERRGRSGRSPESNGSSSNDSSVWDVNGSTGSGDDNPLWATNLDTSRSVRFMIVGVLYLKSC